MKEKNDIIEMIEYLYGIFDKKFLFETCYSCNSCGNRNLCDFEYWKQLSVNMNRKFFEYEKNFTYKDKFYSNLAIVKG